jgi:hypothetical protein
MAYRQRDLHQSKTHSYDKLFHQNTGANSANNIKRFEGNKQILNYRLFNGQYEQQPQNPFEEFNENAKNNRQAFQSSLNNGNSVEQFNRNIDKIHMPFDIQRPVSTRDQIKSEYETENKSLYDHQKINDYMNQHQFMPGQLGNMNGSRFDFYSMNNDGGKQNGFEDYF